MVSYYKKHSSITSGKTGSLSYFTKGNLSLSTGMYYRAKYGVYQEIHVLERFLPRKSIRFIRIKIIF